VFLTLVEVETVGMSLLMSKETSTTLSIMMDIGEQVSRRQACTATLDQGQAADLVGHFLCE
jgi:hypothetical protein